MDMIYFGGHNFIRENVMKMNAVHTNLSVQYRYL